jgi:hypothetical protein
MKKMKVLGSGNNDCFNYLIVEKEKEFLERLNELLFDSFSLHLPEVMIVNTNKIDRKFISEKIEVMDAVDIHECVGEDDETRVDVFYGNEKVFICFNCFLDKRKKFMDKLERISEFVE